MTLACWPCLALVTAWVLTSSATATARPKAPAEALAPDAKAPAPAPSGEPVRQRGARLPAAPKARIPDVILTDQHGRRHRFYSDLVKDRLVLMNAVYTTCSGTCPMQTSIFAQTRRLLASRDGPRTQMLSVSLDPEHDTPEKLRAFAARYSTGPEWLFLTGAPDDVHAVLRAMDLDAPAPEQHTPLCVVGHERSGTWMKLVNLTSPADIVARLEAVQKGAPRRAP